MLEATQCVLTSFCKSEMKSKTWTVAPCNGVAMICFTRQSASTTPGRHTGIYGRNIQIAWFTSLIHVSTEILAVFSFFRLMIIWQQCRRIVFVHQLWQLGIANQPDPSREMNFLGNNWPGNLCPCKFTSPSSKRMFKKCNLTSTTQSLHQGVVLHLV